MRDGLSASRVAMAAGLGDTVGAFLAARLPLVADWPARLAQGGVLDAQGRAVQADTPCQPGACLWYWRQVPHEVPVPFEISVLHQDTHLVVVDKPHFLAVSPRGAHVQETVLVRLKRLLGDEDLVPMHRLDRDTAGLLLFTRQPGSRHAYQSLLAQRKVHKVYEAVAPWRPGLALPQALAHRLQEPADARFMQMQVVPGEPNALTELLGVQPLAHSVPPGQGPDAEPRLALYTLRPITGRKHQLRAQMNALGLALVGDRLYPQLLPADVPGQAPDFSQPLQLLAREIVFTDPLSGAERRFRSQRQLAWAVPPSP